MRHQDYQDSDHYYRKCMDYEEHQQHHHDDRYRVGHKRNKKDSAFRAFNTKTQYVKANQSVKVFFNQEEFDLGREYEPCPSIFAPRRDGVYLLTSTVGFAPENTNANYRARVEFRINNQPFEAADNDFWGKGVPFDNAVQVTAILQLRAGDEVEVFLQSSISGSIPASVPGQGVNAFSAARLVDLG